MIFLVSMSILLNLVAIFAIVILYQRQNRLVQAESTQQKMIRELEDILQTFLLEMKEDNERFMSQFQVAPEMKKSSVSSVPPNEEISNSSVSPVSGSKANSFNPIKQNFNLVMNGYTQNLPKDDDSGFSEKLFSQKDQVEINHSLRSTENKTESHFQDTFKEKLSKHNVNKSQTIHEQIDGLLDKGLTLEQIAKKLNKGKTEIELLVKFKG